MKPPLNYTTSIPANRSVSECMAMLAEHGADGVAVTFAGKLPSGLSFQLATPHGKRTFSMPVNFDGVATLLRKADFPATVRPNVIARYITREHAVRVAWRVTKDWLEAQLAIVQAGMVDLQEVMLPYLQIEGRTIWERYQESEQHAITTGGPE